MSLILNFLFVSSIYLVILVRDYVRRRRQTLPPGPKGLPLVGNILDMPSDKQWLTFDTWSKHYGDIVHINVLGRHMIILGSSQAITDIFDKKSSIFSGRPRSTMLNDLVGWDWSFTLMPYGDEWRKNRRAFHQHFQQSAVSRYNTIYLRESRNLLDMLLTEPDGFLHHLRQTFAGTLMGSAYGIRVSKKDDPYVSIAEAAMHEASEVTVPGAFLVNELPILRYIPKWFPGTRFHKVATHLKKLSDEMLNRPFEAVKQSLRDGTAEPSITATLLQSLPADEDNAEAELIAKRVGASAYAAGSDTTVAACHVFMLAMAMYPGVQKRAQAELGDVVGPTRLPDFSDRDSLPYINALIKELSRWQPIVPLGLPHESMEDDEYRGYFIPKGTIVFGNTWSILHDPDEYPEPDVFKPERFLNPDGTLNHDVRDPGFAAFGYGRRVCPGRYFSDSSLYSIVSSVLATFDIKPKTDKYGRPAHLEPIMMPGIISLPAPFECDIKPRSTAAVDLIRGSLDDSL
eukprot:PLAT3293.1.p1 GENE.PLAT3293.1~~PLAT3293.1.p1  ORF type:complete len:514 (-),score=-93.25 PLAT3293.1:19-1560(-)